MKRRKAEPLNITIEKLGEYRHILKQYTITHEFKGRGGDSVMTDWLAKLPDDHLIVLGKHQNNIIGWACGASSTMNDWLQFKSKTIFNHKTCLVGVYVLKVYRKKGYGFQLGKELFKLSQKQGFERIYMNFRTKGAGIMYRNLCEDIGVKRQPFTPASMSYDKTWKIVKLWNENISSFCEETGIISN